MKKEKLTQAERKSAERDRKREAGLVPMEVWIHKTRKGELKKVVEKLKKPTKQLDM